MHYGYCFIIFTAFLSIFSLHSYSQCIADSGSDIHRCSRDSIVQLGGNPSAFGGTPPYSYEWSIDPVPTSSQVVPNIHASNMLDDTTIANPFFTYNGSFLPQDITIYLKVTDNLGCTSFDTMHLSTSIFEQHLMYHDLWIEQGDSVYLNFTPNLSGGYGASTYDWNPSNGLSDTNLAVGFWASPDTATVYTATLTDSKGCSRTGAPLYYIWITALSIEEKALYNVNLFPNPAQNIVFIKNEAADRIKTLKIYNSSGKKIQEFNTPTEQIEISDFAKGIYILRIYFENYEVIRKFVKE